MKVMTATKYNKIMSKKTGKNIGNRPKLFPRSTFETIPSIAIKKKGPNSFGNQFTNKKEEQYAC